MRYAEGYLEALATAQRNRRKAHTHTPAEKDPELRGRPRPGPTDGPLRLPQHISCNNASAAAPEESGQQRTVQIYASTSDAVADGRTERVPKRIKGLADTEEASDGDPRFAMV